MPVKVLRTEATPNPNAMKFVLDRAVWTKPASFFNAESARDYSLAGQLFAVPGVVGVLMLNDFVTVNREPSAPWKAITAAVKRILQSASDAQLNQ
jgi:hypothetical protein